MAQWTLDPDGVFHGQCLAHCVGDPSDPTCPDESDACAYSPSFQCATASGPCGGSGCLPRCNPLDNNCGEGLLCDLNGEAFVCRMNFPLEDTASFEECSPGRCGPADLCVPTWASPTDLGYCEAPFCCSICSPICDTRSGECPAGSGAVCIPFNPTNDPELATLGVCMRPQAPAPKG